MPGGQRIPDGHPVHGKGMVCMTKEKRPHLNRAGNMDIDAWRERQISKRLKDRLSAQTQEFILQHDQDTDEQLREYVRQKAMYLHRMPHPLELPGGSYLTDRLGDWNRLARELGYFPASKERGLKAYKRMREQEAELFAQERRAIKEAKRQKSHQLVRLEEEQS